MTSWREKYRKLRLYPSALMDAENEEFRPEMGKKDDAWAKNGFSLLQN
jgi:hypothetical protein